MTTGADAHAAGRVVEALSAFQSALDLSPDNEDAVSACAAVLFELQRPRAALGLLRRIENHLLATADGCRNLAMATMAAGDIHEAWRCVHLALAITPDHLPALSLQVQLAVQLGRWDEAVHGARRSLELAPKQDWPWLQLIDLLCVSRQIDEARALAETACRHFPGHQRLGCQRVLVMSLSGDFDAATQQMHAMGASGADIFSRFLLDRARDAPAATGHLNSRNPDLVSLYSQWTLDGFGQCDWREQTRALQIVRAQLQPEPALKDTAGWCAMLRYGATLGLQDLALACLRGRALAAATAGPTRQLPPFRNRPAPVPTERLRVGILMPSLRDARVAATLSAQLALHDPTRFVFFLYASTPEPQALFSALLQDHQVVETAHFNDEELVLRIRLDRLDLWMDLCVATPWWRPALARHRVAPLQMLPPDCSAAEADGSYDYVLSDVFIMPPPEAAHTDIATVRMQHACWPLEAPAQDCAHTVSRDALNLEPGAVVLCAWTCPTGMDSESFGLWMRILAAQPEAVLWLAAPHEAVAVNLQREAEARGIPSARLRFIPLLLHPQALAWMRHADLFLDPLRVSAHAELADALSLGIPAISCAGQGVASRMGASLLRAAGCADQVVYSEEDYFLEAVTIIRDGALRESLRRRLQAFNQSEVATVRQAAARELASAWTMVIARSRAGLKPAAVDSAEHPQL